MILDLKLYLYEVSLFKFVDKDLLAANSKQLRCVFWHCLGLGGLTQSPLTLTERYPLALYYINPCVLKGLSVAQAPKMDTAMAPRNCAN